MVLDLRGDGSSRPCSMKSFLLPIQILGATLFQASCQPVQNVPEKPAAPQYLSESPLPKGWPQPGPYNQVAEKKYPAARAAFTPSKIPTFGFLTLFNHIKKNQIPMTSPVEMTMKPDEDEALEMNQMGFLYQSTDVGNAGADGKKVTVRDVPAVTVLAYTWQGSRNDAAIAKARAAIEAALAEKKLQSTGYRLFGYNSPSIPANKQTHELQAILKE
jgi:hypothetical protein